MCVHSLLLLLMSCTAQAEECRAARAAADEAAGQVSALNQAVSSLQADKATLVQQVKKLTAEKASLSEQLGSSGGDIDMLQVCVLVCVLCVQEFQAHNVCQSDMNMRARSPLSFTVA